MCVAPSSQQELTFIASHIGALTDIIHVAIYFSVFEKVNPWPRAVKELCWLWLAILSGSKDLDFEGRD